jgi:hypothetical protein
MNSAVEKQVLVLFKYLLLKAIRGSMETTKFNKRAFYSTGMLLSGLFLPVSGIINHYTGFDGLTTERHFWMSVHNISALLFVVFAILHIRLNWKALSGYLNKAKSVVISKEAIYAAMFVIFLVGLFSMHALAVGRH